MKQTNYTIFQNDILKRQILKVPSDRMWEYDGVWTEPNKCYEAIIEIIDMEQTLEDDYVYILRLERTGSPYEIKWNDNILKIEEATKKSSERIDNVTIPTQWLQQHNTLVITSLDEDTTATMMIHSVKLLKRPHNHIIDYDIHIDYDKDYIQVHVNANYATQSIPTTCVIMSLKGKNIAKAKLDEFGNVTMKIRRKYITLWNDETHMLYHFILLTEKEVIAQPIAFQNTRFEQGKFYCDERAIPLRLINATMELKKPSDTWSKEWLITQMALWKKRNFNAIYVEETEDVSELKALCFQFGFYYISNENGIDTKEKKELIITTTGIIKKMPKVYLPLKAWIVEQQSGMLAMKNELLFQNLQDTYYVRIAVYQNGKRIGQKLKYILDFEPGMIEMFRPEWVSKLTGDVVVKIEFYQRIKTELIEKDDYYGAIKVKVEKE